jgi:hypothetical protein
MRNHFLILLFFVVLSAGCSKKSDTVFSETPDQRLAKTLSDLETKLIGGQYGWVGMLEPKSGTPFYFYFIFKADNRVSMLSDFNVTTATVLKESSYRLKALQQPTLIFDTYSYLHLLADPDPSVAGGIAGKGYNSDFEFGYDPTTAQPDTIIFTGRQNGTKLTLVRATQQQGNDYLSGSLAKSFAFNKISALSTYIFDGTSHDFGVGGKIFTYWKRFTIGGTTYEVDEGSFDPINRSITFSWYNGSGQKTSFSTTYHFGAGNVVFDKPFVAGTTTITEFTNIVWNDPAKSLKVNINNTPTPTTFTGAIAPLYYDTTSFTKFRNEGVTNYWISNYGFMRNGVYNNFGLDTLSATTAAGKNTYYYSIYWPEYGTDFDLFAPVFLNPPQTGLTLVYGFAAVNNSAQFPIVKDGIANFNYGGNVGNGTPTTGGWAGTQSLFRSNTGYYFIKQPGGGYDQVAVSDAQSWMNWTK